MTLFVSQPFSGKYRRTGQGCLVSRKDWFAHGKAGQGCLVNRKACSAHVRVSQGCLVSRKACSAHGKAGQGCLGSRKARFAHGRAGQGCLVSRKVWFAHGRACQGCLVSRKGPVRSREDRPRLFREQERPGSLTGGPAKAVSGAGKARFAHGRVCQGCLVSRKVWFAHGRVCQGCRGSEDRISAHESFGFRGFCCKLRTKALRKTLSSHQ